ncbi:unnamed protein product [Sphenostylis stenocarpa]|uniref:Uncharacterized protein n=1 Tax=Sphenostylis stenocarpa TaxID=92480 RepID=A0AA86TMA0_9FABA|nr:unnamed protein product [Sphenostylis stenocarpa]
MEYLGIDLSCAVGSLRHGHFPEKDCLLPLISKLLGYAIVAASTTVKLPQALIVNRFIISFFDSHVPFFATKYYYCVSVRILKILKHQSVRGLSMISFELEVVGYTIALAYCLYKGLPFSAYGELLFLLIQEYYLDLFVVHDFVHDFDYLTASSSLFFDTAVILVAIIYYYSRPLNTITWIRALLYCAVAPTILAGQIDPFLFEALYASQHAIFLFARIPQIWQNFSLEYSQLSKKRHQIVVLMYDVNLPLRFHLTRVLEDLRLKYLPNCMGQIALRVAIYWFSLSCDNWDANKRSPACCQRNQIMSNTCRSLGYIDKAEYIRLHHQKAKQMVYEYESDRIQYRNSVSEDKNKQTNE